MTLEPQPPPPLADSGYLCVLGRSHLKTGQHHSLPLHSYDSISTCCLLVTDNADLLKFVEESSALIAAY